MHGFSDQNPNFPMASWLKVAEGADLIIPSFLFSETVKKMIFFFHVISVEISLVLVILGDFFGT